jgi:formate hydrogenlyase subunit 4
MRPAVLAWTEKADAVLIALVIVGIVIPELNPANVASGKVAPLVVCLWIAAIATPLLLIFRTWTSRGRLWRAVGWGWMLFLLVWVAFPG